MPNNLYGDVERSRETLWARKEDAKALDALRRKIDAEIAMAENLQALKDAPRS